LTEEINRSDQKYREKEKMNEIKNDNEKIIRDRVKQWETAWNLGSKPFSIPQTPSIIRGYKQYVETWEPFMQGFSAWNIKINDDLKIHAGDRVSVATFTWKIWGMLRHVCRYLNSI
jgi:hypothetical protein